MMTGRTAFELIVRVHGVLCSWRRAGGPPVDGALPQLALEEVRPAVLSIISNDLFSLAVALFGDPVEYPGGDR